MAAVDADEFAFAWIAAVPHGLVVAEMIDDVYSLYPECVENTVVFMLNNIMMIFGIFRA